MEDIHPFDLLCFCDSDVSIFAIGFVKEGLEEIQL